MAGYLDQLAKDDPLGRGLQDIQEAQGPQWLSSTVTTTGRQFLATSPSLALAERTPTSP